MPSDRSPSRFASVALFLLVPIVAGCTGAPGTSGSGPCTYTPVAGFSHLHGLALHPERPEELYAATHHGLFRALNDTGWARVGTSQDDLMGFLVHPSNGSTFWASGHLASGGNMGVRVSRDGGCSWETLAAKDWDFHALTVSPADPDRLWGFYRGELRGSTDGGTTWEVLGRPPAMGSLAADPRDADVLYATTLHGLQTSSDGGRNWVVLNQTQALGVAVDPTDPRVLYRGGAGFAEKSTDGGRTWTALPIDLAGGTAAYFAVHPRDPRIVYAGTAQGAIHKSTDGGASWDLVKAASS